MCDQPLRLSDAKYLDMVRAAANTSDATRSNYIYNLRRVVRLISEDKKGKPVDLGWVLRHPAKAFGHLQIMVNNRASLRTLVASVLALIKHAGIKKDYKECSWVFRKWYGLYIPLREEVRQETEGNAATGRLLAGAVKWQDVLTARDKLATNDYGGRDHLVLSIYTYLAPRRQGDYWNMQVIIRRPYPKRYLELPAYLDMTVDPPRMTVSQYKTSKKYDAWTKDLVDPELVSIIRASLQRHPRTHLFVQRNGEPFTRVNAYTKFSNNALKRALGNPDVTLNSLRHAAVKASLSSDEKSFAEKKEYAQDMGHSFVMHNIYNKVIKQYPDVILNTKETKGSRPRKSQKELKNDGTSSKIVTKQSRTQKPRGVKKTTQGKP